MKKISKLETEIHILKQQVSKLEQKIEDNDSYERRDIFVLSGTSLPHISNRENCPQLVSKFP